MREPLVAVVSVAAGGAVAGMGSAIAVGLALARRRGRWVEAREPARTLTHVAPAVGRRGGTAPSRVGELPLSDGQDKPRSHKEVWR